MIEKKRNTNDAKHTVASAPGRQSARAQRLADMRVLQLGKFYPLRGGVEKVMYSLMEGLSARELRCDMLCASETGSRLRENLNPWATLMCSPSWGKLNGTMMSPRMISAMRRIASTYDIVHVHHPDPMAALSLWLSGFKGRVVLHWHSDIVKQHRMLQAYKPLQRWLLRRADVIVCTTEPYMRGSEYLKPYLQKCTVVPIGIPALQPDTELTRSIAERYAGRKLLFALGRLVPYKGFEHLVEAAALLPDEYVVVIGGTGPLRSNLEHAIAERGLEDKVILAGYLSDQEVGAYFGACTMFCFPSVQKTEAFGIVQLEAMSVGKPIVATDIPGSGVSWVDAHGVSGLNVPVGDAQALADAIQQISSTPEALRKFARGAQQRYQDTFTHDKMVESTIRIYSSIL